MFFSKNVMDKWKDFNFLKKIWNKFYLNYNIQFYNSVFLPYVMFKCILVQKNFIINFPNSINKNLVFFKISKLWWPFRHRKTTFLKKLSTKFHLQKFIWYLMFPIKSYGQKSKKGWNQCFFFSFLMKCHSGNTSFYCRAWNFNIHPVV